MSLESRLDMLAKGWRGPLVAAFIALLCGLPGLMAMPPIDRDEARFSQATAQMLESDDYVAINFQDRTRDKKPVGIHWMQAASVALFSDVENRDIWPYRLPSLLGAMLAALACAWGARAFWNDRTAMLAGAMFGSGFLLSTEAFIAKTDSVLAACTTVALAALARMYAAHRAGAPPLGRPTKLVLWVAIAIGILVKGPVVLMVLLLTLAALWASDRQARWMKDIGWGWGLVLILAICGPWALAITVSTDGAFWGSAIGGDLAPKLVGGHERHGGPIGYHVMASILTMFPWILLAPAAVMLAWKQRSEPGVRFALCWLIPTWLLFEILPTKLPHYTLPAHAAAYWLIAAAVMAAPQLWSRIAGVALLSLASLLLAAVAIYGMSEFGDAPDLVWTILTAAVFLAVAVVAGVMIYRQGNLRTVLAVGVVAALGHALLVGQLMPRLEPLWLAPRLAMALKRTGLDPQVGRTPGPIETAGYSEPSLVFALGTRTGLGGPADAVRALAEGRPAIVEQREQKEFLALMQARGVPVDPITRLKGFNYAKGDEMDLTIYRGLPRATDLARQPAAATPASRELAAPKNSDALKDEDQ
ncbi:glycosyltransferase family 39 protein [Caulobacter sp. NIBR1757]|uniref:ArnT family glycosyltransferase n=1 Tax=Caulobacter sp. NIBR1757 TaxID=3016000 RepID=UPI0022F0A014|nr:glycosyltransferase family 39 protein [Caulobacter sp. NIBR1757]WGM38258.1 Undecaprenyl phosphate-alpha-4-amino-4-deoxy-L-arabinose arabinosyl transferase [Caulobacter sp. NIBR1757]